MSVSFQYLYANCKTWALAALVEYDSQWKMLFIVVMTVFR